MGKRFYIADVKDISPEIKIGKNVYYVSTLQDKHIHAGKDGVKIYTSDGKNKLLNKGEWIGEVYSFHYQKDKNGNDYARLMLKASAYFPQNKLYFLEFADVDSISESLLKHNYAKIKKSTAFVNMWMLWGGILIPWELYQRWKNGNIDPKNPLPTKDEEDETDKKRKEDEKALDDRDDFWKKFFKDAGKYVIGGVAVVGGLILLNNLTKK